MPSFKDRLKALRAPFFTASALPVILGAALARRDGAVFDWPIFLAALLGAVLLHAGANLANDYYDHRSGADEANENYIPPFTGGSRLIQEGVIGPGWFLKAAAFSFILAGFLGLYLFLRVGQVVLWLGFFGAISGFFYTAPPFKLSHRGLGEFIVALDFGVLTTLGGYVVLAGRLSWTPVLASAPLALFITAVLLVNGLPDAAGDAAVGKRTLAVRLGPARATLFLGILFLSAFVSAAALSASGLLPPASLLALLALPLALRSWNAARRACREGAEAPAPAALLFPACSGTILTHLAAGLLLVAGVFLG